MSFTGELNMNLRAFLIAGVAMLVGVSLMFSMVGSTAAQQSTARTPPVGRFQMAFGNGAVVVLDTTTGECWVNDGKKWTVFGNPTKTTAEK
jgi:hypothetical protein